MLSTIVFQEKMEMWTSYWKETDLMIYEIIVDLMSQLDCNKNKPERVLQDCVRLLPFHE